MGFDVPNHASERIPHKRGRGLCIFCERESKMSREHLWPQWSRQFIPRQSADPARANHSTNLQWQERGAKVTAVWQRGLLARAGDPIDQRLKVVCKRCNESWMSQIQVQAKPVLSPLIQGHWSHVLDGRMQHTLAVWAAMFTMVLECADRKTMAISQEERSKFFTKRELPRNWRVWIGRNSGFRSQFWHRGIALATEISAHKMRECNIQVSTFTFGSIIFQTLSSRFSGADSRLDALLDYYDREGVNVHLMPIWPVRSSSAVLPDGSVHDSDFAEISTEIANRIAGLDPRWREV